MHALLRWTTIVAALLGIATSAAALTPGQLCEKKAVNAFRKCEKTVAKQALKCLQKTSTGCIPGDPKIQDALAKVEASVLDACPDGATLLDAGYPGALTPQGLADRLQEACESTAVSLVARSFGGPHAAVRAGASTTDRSCLDYAYTQGLKLVDYTLRQQSTCVLASHAGKTCDPATTEARIASRKTKVVASVTKKCPDLGGLVAGDPTLFASLAVDQGGCLTAAVHAGTAPLTLSCGPRAAAPVPPLATPTQVVLPASTGARCGDGSPYAFWIRLPASGLPVNKVVVFMMGGGSCADGPDCVAQGADLMESLGDTMTQTAHMNSTAATNPFRDWTKVFLPYCTQDLHSGAGVTNVFPEITVHRNGALNVRATMRQVRDILWSVMDASDPEGYRPDRVTMLLTGSSAGGYGAMHNYHYVLDELRWTHTTVVPDAALSMDDGLPGGTADRATFAMLPDSPGWNARLYATPYCHTPICAELLNTLELAHAPRLKAAPEMQILNLSNQVDNVQRNTQAFPDTPSHTNLLRVRYCAQQGTPGLHSFLSASSSSVHGQIFVNAQYNSVTIGGTLMRDWLGQAMNAPDTLTDEIATGTIEQDRPGVLPFPCAVSSPSGAFL